MREQLDRNVAAIAVVAVDTIVGVAVLLLVYALIPLIRTAIKIHGRARLRCVYKTS